MAEQNDKDAVRDAVRDRYAQIAKAGSSCCCTPASEADPAVLDRKAGHEESLKLGYSEEDLAAVPEGANLGLGCGNPQAIAALKPGEVVVDLGAGAGFDCFLAARAV